MTTAIELSLQGDRNYIDIAQVSYKALESLRIDLANPTISDFFISIDRPITQKITVVPRVNSKHPSTAVLAWFEFTEHRQKKIYDIFEHTAGLPTDRHIPEPDFAEYTHWKKTGDQIHWLSQVNCMWPIFFAYMLMGRLSGIHIFGGIKPKGLNYSMSRIPKPDEITKLWVQKKRGPLNGLGIIDLYCGDEKIGSSVLKI